MVLKLFFVINMGVSFVTLTFDVAFVSEKLFVFNINFNILCDCGGMEIVWFVVVVVSVFVLYLFCDVVNVVIIMDEIFSFVSGGVSYRINAFDITFIFTCVIGFVYCMFIVLCKCFFCK